MPTPISGIRIARSFIGAASASSAEEVELDFDLAVNEGIEIFAVVGGVHEIDSSGVLGASMTDAHGIQTLHVTDNPTEINNLASANNQFDLDSDIIYEQTAHFGGEEDDTNGSGSFGIAFVPNGAVVYPEPILAVRNLTHRSDGSFADGYAPYVHMHYRFVRLSQAELGFALARRGR